MSPKKLRTNKANIIKKNLEESLAEKRAGRVFGPFTNAQEAMEFLQDFQHFVLLFEKALREAARLGKRYDPKTLHWLLDLEDRVLERKLRGIELVKA